MEPASRARLKIVSWNIGLRGLEKLCSSCSEESSADVHGITRRAGFGSLLSMLRALDADVVCLQEVKMRALGAPERALALAEGWESYFAICRTQNSSTSYGRYAGVATFCRVGRCAASRAEEGVTGVLGRRGIAAGGAFAGDVAASGVACDAADRELDGEGRCVTTVHGDLAIVNVYVPAISAAEESEAFERRRAFKAAFLSALERRCAELLSQGLRVLVIGDFNIAPAPIDSAREMQASAC